MSAFQIDLPDAVLEQLAQRVADKARGDRDTDRNARPLVDGRPGRHVHRQQAQRVYDLRSSGRLTRHGDGARALVDKHELDQLIRGDTRP
jgi:hypothetical protein